MDEDEDDEVDITTEESEDKAMDQRLLKNEKAKDGIEYNVGKYIGVNIGSITIGAICFMAATAWIDFFRDLTDETYLNYYDRYRHRYQSSRRSLLTAIVFTVIAVFSVIGMYSWYNHSQLQVECQGDEDNNKREPTDKKEELSTNAIRNTTNSGILFAVEDMGGEVVTTTDASPDGSRYD